MQFNSVIFLIYLIVVVGLFYQLKPAARRWLILAASYFFYGYWSVPFSGLLVFSTVLDWAASLWIQNNIGWKKRVGLGVSMLGNLGVLGLFKYADFFSDSAYGLLGVRPWPHLDLILPLGISFYTFQTMSYTIDVYRGHLKAHRSIFDVAMYVSFFPQLVAGPIVRADELLSQLKCEQRFDWGNIRLGVGQIIWGMIKKVYFADTCAHIVNLVYGDPSNYTGLSLLFATYAFAIQIYCDFSGYCDIAIGSARLLGMKLPKNFDSPYLSTSIQEFWRRWHITLSTWLRDYLYIPLGGNRKGTVRTYANLMITMILGGLWHGAGWNWVVWGGLQGLVMSIERMLGLGDKRIANPFYRVFRWFITFHIVCVSWVLFRSHSLAEAGLIFKRIFTMADGSFTLGIEPVVVLALLLMAQLMMLRDKWLAWFESHPPVARWVTYATVLMLVLTFHRSVNPEFIYFQF